MRALLLLICFCLPALSHAWWSDDWPYRVPVTLDMTAQGAAISENQENRSLLVRIHAGNFGDFFLLKEDLGDLRFIAGDDKTPLAHQVESFDLANQMLFVWVQVPLLSGGINTEKVWMYYGNQEASNNEIREGIDDADTSLVMHFKAGMPGADATAYKQTAQLTNAEVNAAALIAGGAEFTGTSFIQVNDAPSLQFDSATGASFSAWVKAAEQKDDRYLLYRAAGGNTLILVVNGNTLSATLSTAKGTFQTSPVPALSVGSWHHVGLDLSQSRMVIYVDGKEMAATAIELPVMTGNIFIGGDGAGGHGFIGTLDEVRISRVSRGAGAYQLASANQGPMDKLVALQAAEQLGAGGGHGAQMLKIMLDSTDAAGWVVLGSLILMAFVCFAVIIGKTLYLRYVLRDNRAFLEQYAQLGSGDPTLLDHADNTEDKELENSPIAQALFGSHDHFQSSPIYRMYHRGVQEVRNRVTGPNARGLGDASMDAIRAAMDAAMTRELQRLNSQLIMLTIGVSGGPFIGLFGTVMGVMITFAAIAASGDVNINAIAPGVAAALLATLAGLLVAIPSMFGYNYLVAQVKDVTADMRVFTDEFITRVAEYHAGKAQD